MLFLSSLVFLAVVDANPLSRSTDMGTLPFKTNLYAQPIHGIVERDRARVQAIDQGHRISAISNASFSFVDIGVGSPPTNYELAIDTGSSNTWVGAIKSYVKTETSQNTGRSFGISYGNANVSGEEWIDTVTLSRDLVVSQQSIGIANHSENFSLYGFDGLLGLGPTDLTKHTVEGEDEVPTVMDNLYSQGSISEKVIGIGYIPYCEQNNGGELTFGGYDESATTSRVVYAPVTKSLNASRYWAFDYYTLSYGGESIMPPTVGIVDTGTTLVLLPTNAFEAYQSKTGATYDNSTGLYRITPDKYDKLEPLTFHIEGEPFVLTPNAQILPRSITNGTILLAVHQMTVVGSHWSIIGFSFLQCFYSVYDSTNNRIDFATTCYTNSTCH